MRIDDSDYRLMVESVTDYGIFLLDGNGFVQTWNAGAAQIKGYSAEEIIGQHFSIFYPAEINDRGWPTHELQTAKALGRFEDEGWRIRKDGTRFWANIIITKLVNYDGTFRGFCKITRDLSERRRHEELLRYSEERFRLMVEGVKDYAIFMLDPSGHIISWNIGAKLNKGYEESEIVGKHFSVFYPPEVVASGLPARELEEALRVGRYEDEGWRIRKDGTRFWANVVITSLFDASGRHRGFAKVTRDLTEKRKMSELEDEGRQTSKFLAMLGHELRNPLAPITNALAVVALDANQSDLVRQMRDVIGRQIGHMTQIIDDLLDVGRITSGKINLDKKPVKLQAVILEAIETVEPMARGKMNTLQFHADSAAVWVAGDRTRLTQVVVNLLTNAIKFTPTQGLIEITVRASDHCQNPIAEISVKDNGIGIAPYLLPSIFELFVQGEQDSARTHGGLGLGLSLARELVGMHGGSINAYSAGLDKGSEFVIQLPQIKAPVERPTLAERRADVSLAKHILIVDDHSDSATTLAMLLRGIGYQAQIVNGGADAIEYVKRDCPDLVLMDIGLPDISGIEVAKRIMKEVADPPPMVAVTGYGQDSDRDDSHQAGFYAHLVKPLDIPALISLLKKVLE